MMLTTKNRAKSLLIQGEKEIMFKIDLNPVTKLQLYLTGNAIKGVELFGIGPNEIRGFGFMIDFLDLINYAVNNNYRVFVFKEGRLFTRENWYLKFIKE